MTDFHQTYMSTRGRELPGNYSHILLTELFHHQSKRWPMLAQNHIDKICDIIHEFVKKALQYMPMEEYVRAELKERIHQSLQESRLSAERELAKLCADEKEQPITYNRKCLIRKGSGGPTKAESQRPN